MKDSYDSFHSQQSTGSNYDDKQTSRMSNNGPVSTAFSSKASAGQRISSEVRDLKGQVDTLMRDSERKDHRVEALMKEIQSLRATTTNHQVLNLFTYQSSLLFLNIAFLSFSSFLPPHSVKSKWPTQLSTS